MNYITALTLCHRYSNLQDIIKWSVYASHKIFKYWYSEKLCKYQAKLLLEKVIYVQPIAFSDASGNWRIKVLQICSESPKVFRYGVN